MAQNLPYRHDMFLHKQFLIPESSEKGLTKLLVSSLSFSARSLITVDLQLLNSYLLICVSFILRAKGII